MLQAASEEFVVNDYESDAGYEHGDGSERKTALRNAILISLAVTILGSIMFAAVVMMRSPPSSQGLQGLQPSTEQAILSHPWWTKPPSKAKLGEIVSRMTQLRFSESIEVDDEANILDASPEVQQEFNKLLTKSIEAGKEQTEEIAAWNRKRGKHGRKTVSITLLNESQRLTPGQARFRLLAALNQDDFMRR